MKKPKIISLTLCSLSLLFASISHSDVLINVSATMINPACVVSSIDGSSPLQIGFGNVNLDTFDKQTSEETFSINIDNCDLRKALVILLSPKKEGTLLYEGKNVLATTTDGLGIKIDDITSGKRPLEMGLTQRIYPRVSGNRGMIDLQAQLVRTVAAEKLELGRFTSAMTVLVTYN